MAVARGLRSYQYVVVNDRLERAVGALDAIVGHERARLGGAPDPEATRTAGECRREAVQLGGWGG